jgi:hypothetical protein
MESQVLIARRQEFVQLVAAGRFESNRVDRLGGNRTLWSAIIAWLCGQQTTQHVTALQVTAILNDNGRPILFAGLPLIPVDGIYTDRQAAADAGRMS